MNVNCSLSCQASFQLLANIGDPNNRSLQLLTRESVIIDSVIQTNSYFTNGGDFLKLLTKTEKTTIKRFENFEKANEEIGIDRIVEFLHTHLEEYGDDRSAIRRSLDYAFSDEKGKGGFVLVAMQGRKIAGASVVNDTGMKGYIPEHILVYIAVDRTVRGAGIGKKLVEQIKTLCNGDIALHVEQNNPARFLYKKMGFKTKYAEMRFAQE